MPTTQTKRTAAPRAAKPQDVQITITIPGPAMPLLRALAGLADETDSETATRAVLWWLQSEEAMSYIDDEVNLLMRLM